MTHRAFLPDAVALTRAKPGRTTPRLIVAIATADRPAILPAALRCIAAQDRRPDLLLLCVTSLSDIGDLAPDALPFPIEILIGPRGAARQRNRAIDAARAGDVLLFLDDDFLAAPDYLRRTEELFLNNPEVVVATGTLLADGILGPGLDVATGQRLLAEGIATPSQDGLAPVYAGYGCNMALRAGTLLERNLRFDETLPMYSWLEDLDLSRRMAAHGRIVKSASLRGVHLGTKTGRTPGLCLGYSQIANPAYLLRKGSISRRHALKLIARALASNLLRAIKPPPWADYRGRLRGNLRAVADVLRRRDSPARILGFKV